jgi:DNA-binding MarR family transcriptional regulator
MANNIPEDCWIAMRGLRRLLGSLTQSARAVEQRTGITNAQLFLLRELAEAGPLTINQLAERTRTGQNTVSSVVTRLEDRGLVVRGRTAADGRIVTVTITPAGRRGSKHAPEAPTERILDALCNLTPTELRTVTRAVDILNERLGVPEDVETGMLFEGPTAQRPKRRPAR